ncbi:MAG: hypothetical protein C0606_07915 [Hyphomicrobiales bacterium]|nr:MAG: hypothetical protein C0606_07915 [Hyphomicrobiales bacterium]
MATTGGDFWKNSGYHLLEKGEDGYLRPTDAFLRAYLLRPELEPVPESCPAELALHAALLDEPTRDVDAATLGELADADARENYEVFLGYRDRLLSEGSLERCYLSLVRKTAPVRVPALFIDHLVHAIARNIFDGTTDPFVLRAAEILFREQMVNLVGGSVLFMDSEISGMMRERQERGHISLIEIAANPLLLRQTTELDVLSLENASRYFERSDRYDFALDMTYGRPGGRAFATMLERWIAHFLKIAVKIEPVEEIDDDHWSWHVGLDVDATALLNDLYDGREVDDERMARLMALFQLNFVDSESQRADIAGRPVYLALCRKADGRLHMKPQNLLVNLPLATPA